MDVIGTFARDRKWVANLWFVMFPKFLSYGITHTTATYRVTEQARGSAAVYHDPSPLNAFDLLRLSSVLVYYIQELLRRHLHADYDQYSN